MSDQDRCKFCGVSGSLIKHLEDKGFKEAELLVHRYAKGEGSRNLFMAAMVCKESREDELIRAIIEWEDGQPGSDKLRDQVDDQKGIKQ